MTTADQYADFAVREARGVSPVYERLSLAVSGDDALLALLDTLPPGKRQPNLLFGVVRLLGGPVEDPLAFRDFTVASWSMVAEQLRARATQTNESGRCAVLLPVLSRLTQPLALLEVGASAGLCLYPDRYGYRYGDFTVGTGPPVLDCDATGMTPPDRLPEVVWRAGLDLNPLDVTHPEDVAWLDALIWPEHEHRRARLRAAAAVAADDPPLLVRGDLVDDLPALAARAPVVPRWSCSTRRSSTWCPRSDGSRSPRSYAGCPGTGSPTRHPTCCDTTGACRTRPTSGRTTCSRWTGATGLDAWSWAGVDLVRVTEVDPERHGLVRRPCPTLRPVSDPDECRWHSARAARSVATISAAA
jgi:hypothetical protein